MWNPTSSQPSHSKALKQKAHRGIVQNRTDIAVLDLIKGVDVLDTIVEQLVEDETNSGSARQLVQRQVVRVSVDHGPEL